MLKDSGKKVKTLGVLAQLHRTQRVMISKIAPMPLFKEITPSITLYDYSMYNPDTYTVFNLNNARRDLMVRGYSKYEYDLFGWSSVLPDMNAIQVIRYRKRAITCNNINRLYLERNKRNAKNKLYFNNRNFTGSTI